MEEVPAGDALQIAVPLVVSLLVVFAVVAAVLIRHALGQAGPGTVSLSRSSEPVSWPLAALIVTLVFLVANQLLVRGAGAGIWDVDGQFHPYFVLVADHVRAGRFVSWDPWTNGGLPALGDPQLGAFSPIVNLLGALFGGTSLGFRAYWLLVWWAGGMGMLFLGRHLGTPPWGAAVVALGFLFCGVYTGNAEHTPWIAAYSFLPFIVWRFDAALQSGRLLPAAEAGTLWGLSGLAGYPGVIVITGCFCALWALGRWAVHDDLNATGPPGDFQRRQLGGNINPRHALVSLGVVAVIGAIILSPTYISFFYEGAGMTPRAGALSRQDALENAFDPAAIASIASPYLPTLKVQHPQLWPASDVSMVNVYAGVVIPVLALFALLRRPRALWRWWLLALAALSLATAVGDALPLRGWLYDVFYPMRFFRHSAIFRLYFVFTLCVLAFVGMRDLATHLGTGVRGSRLRLLMAALASATVALLIGASFLGSGWEAGFPRGAVLLGRGHFSAVWVGIVVIASLVYGLRRAARPYPIAVLFLALASADAMLTSTISVPTMLRLGAHRELWRELDAAHSASLDLTPRGLDRLASACPRQPPEARCRRNDQMITKVPVLDAYASERNPYQMAIARNRVLRESAIGADRIWFSPYAPRVPPTDHVFAAFTARADSLGAVPLVIHEQSALLAQRRTSTAAPGRSDSSAADQIGGLPAAQRVPAELIAYSATELVLDVAVEADGWLLVTDRWARGWKVEVNRIERPLYGGNFIFRAVPVTAGANRIRFTFQPLVLPWLLVLSWGVLAAVGIASTGAAIRASRGMA